MINSEQLEQLKNYLEGSCKTISEAMNELFDLDEDVLTQEQEEDIVENIFNCDQCGWWFEFGEESGIDDSDLICNDCAED